MIDFFNTDLDIVVVDIFTNNNYESSIRKNQNNESPSREIGTHKDLSREHDALARQERLSLFSN